MFSELLRTVNWGSLYLALNSIELFLKTWWWVFLPFILWGPARFLWLFWRTEIWMRKIFRPILLEVRIPKESIKPVRAMENVLAGIWQACYEPPNWIEKWWEGQVLLSIHFEIVSIGGEIHFYIRSDKKYRDPIEANIYSQYPEAEITVAEDYTKYVPQDIPNKDWDLWATDYRLLKENPYPILTYKKFETESEKEEEKRVDPVAALLENLAKTKPGEQFWVQISACPIADEAAPFIKEGKEIRDKLAKRPEKPKQKPLLQEAAEILITGKPSQQPEVLEMKDLMPPEMRLTPGEKEIVEGVENKIAKPVFVCNIRFIYLGKKDVWYKPNLRLGFGFFANYMTQNLNGLVPYGKTLTKVKSRPPISIFDARRLYLRQRKIFRNYKDRLHCYFPLTVKWPGVFILNTEELTSLFHFPSWRVSPVAGVSRVEAKKGPPSEIPTE